MKPNAPTIQLAAAILTWFRAIYAAETPVGFLMLYDDPEAERYYLWRFMINARYQKLGYGRKAMELLIEHAKARPGARRFFLSCVPEECGPEPFYQKFGFERTAKMHGIEAEMCLEL